MKKVIFIIIIFIFFNSIKYVTAESTTTLPFFEKDEKLLERISVSLNEIKPQDLGIKDQKILPDSRWYWIKNFYRKVKLYLSFSAGSKAERLIQYSNEKLFEIKKLAEKKKLNSAELKGYLEKYWNTLSEAQNYIKKIKDKKKLDAILNKITNDEFVKQRIFNSLYEKFKDDVVLKYKEKSLEAFKKFLDNNKNSIKTDLKKYVDKNITFDKKSIKDLQFFGKIKGLFSDPGTKDAISQAREYAEKKIIENIKDIKEDEISKKINEFFGVTATTTDNIETKNIIERIKEEKAKIEKEMKEKARF